MFRSLLGLVYLSEVEMLCMCRRVAEVFGRVFVLTGIFINGVLNTSAEGMSL